MNLSNFDQIMDRIIFERGLDYYENDLILSLEENEVGVYIAEVEGSELYTIKVELDGAENIVKMTCDCPYDMGPYCKHQAAVLLALRDKYSLSVDTDIYSSNQTSSAVTIKTKKSIDLEVLLSERTKEELITLLLNIATEYDELNQRIELYFDASNEDSLITNAITLIRNYIHKSTDRGGFVTYRNVTEAVKGAYIVLEKAEFVLEQERRADALDLALCVIREMMDLLDYADDSDGTVGAVLDTGLAFIRELVQLDSLKYSVQESLFRQLIQEACNKRYDGWNDWRLELLESCSMLAVTPVLRNQLEEVLSTMVINEKGHSWGASHLEEQVNLIRYSLTLQHEGKDTAHQFILQHLRHPAFRRIVIEEALHNQDFDRVIELTMEGESQDKSLWGLVNEWKKYRYKAYQLAGNMEEQRGLAIAFILDGSYDYYRELKNTYDPITWRSIYPKILELLEGERLIHSEIYPRILIEEGELRKLMVFVEDRPTRLETYYHKLLPDYKEEVYALFIRYIEQRATAASNRRDYQQVCAIIRKLKKAGGIEESVDVTQKLYTKYANRPAFRDELTKV